MQITVDLMELLLTLLILVGVTLGVFLIIFFARLIKTMKHISRLTADLYTPLTQTAEQLPDLIRKFDGVTKDVSDLAKSANETVPAILTDAKTITGAARAGVEAVGSAAESVSAGVSSLFGSADEQPGSFSTIIGVVSQVLQIINLFTHRDKPKQRKPFSGSCRSKKRSR
jgi:uncharacterized protein YoxC